MSFRFSIGGTWIEMHIWSVLFAGAMIYFQIKYGHYSENNLVSITRNHQGGIFLRLGRKRAKVLRSNL